MGKKFRLPDGATLFEQVHALALAQRGPRRPTRAHIEKIEATKKAKRAARQKAITDAWHAKRAAAIKAKRGALGDRWPDRCVRVMAPGKWYADRDLQNLTGCGEDHPVQVVALRDRLIERRRNPEWRPQKGLELQQPKWLYRLTATGEARRALCGLLD